MVTRLQGKLPSSPRVGAGGVEGGEDMQVDKVGRRKTKILSWGEGEDEDEVRRASGEPAG